MEAPGIGALSDVTTNPVMSFTVSGASWAFISQDGRIVIIVNNKMDLYLLKTNSKSESQEKWVIMFFIVLVVFVVQT
jgi:hypothetical protein